MNEAFVPLPDGRSIPVSFKGETGGGGVQINYSPVIQAESGADIEEIRQVLAQDKQEFAKQIPSLVNQSFQKGGAASRGARLRK